jgi:hypothetical protein
MALFHRRPVTTAVEAAPIPVPRFSIDGGTLAGDPLAGKLAKGDLRELETLLHGIAVDVDTPYTYERASILLDRAGDVGPALSVCEAWLAHPAAKWPEYLHHTRAIDKRRTRLRARVAAHLPAAPVEPAAS